MNEIVNKFLLVWDKFMTELHLRQPGFAYSACEPFTKNKERIQKFKQTRDPRYIYQNELDKACFQHDMAYGDFKNLSRGTASDKIVHDKAFNIANSPEYDGYQRGLASIVHKFFDKKSSGSGIKIKNISNQRSLDLTTRELLVIRKFKKRKVY